jgi:hypothetical protein
MQTECNADLFGFARVEGRAVVAAFEGPAGCEMSGASAIRQAPARRAQPALVFRQIAAPVQPGHALGAALVEGRGQRLLAGLVTTALTGKDRDPRDPACKKFRAATFDPEHDPAPHVAVRKPVRRQRQDQPSPLLQLVEPYIRGPGRAGIDIDDVGGFEHDTRAIAVHRADMRRLREIRRSAGGELGIEFDRRHPSRDANQLPEYRRVVADAGADMYDMLPRLRCSGGDQRRMKRGLAVVQVALRQDASSVYR